jgi:hypothetical protein
VSVYTKQLRIIPMSLVDFRVVRDPHSFRLEDGTLVLCDDEGQKKRQRVIAVVSRNALEDYFEWPTSTEIRRDSAVDQNLEIFKRIIGKKYARGEHEPWRGIGDTVPLVRIDLADLQNCGQRLGEPPDIEKMAGFVAG